MPFSSPQPQYNEAPWDDLFFQAAENGEIDAMQIALDHGAKIDQQHGENLYTALHIAVAKNHFDAARFLLEKGADPNIGNKRRFTPLFTSLNLSTVDTEMTELLLDFGANPEIPTLTADSEVDEQYPLHEASAKQYHPVLHAILKAGANPFSENRVGSTPRDVAPWNTSDGYRWLEYYEALPYLAPDEIKTKADLFEPAENGYCALDNPRTWKAWGAIVETLRAQGETISKAELLGASGAEGSPFLLQAANARVMDAVVEALNTQGETLRLQELDETRILEDMSAGLNTVVQPLFSIENLGDEPKKTLTRELQLIPEAYMSHALPNRHVLLAEAGRVERMARRMEL